MPRKIYYISVKIQFILYLVKNVRLFPLHLKCVAIDLNCLKVELKVELSKLVGIKTK